MTVHFKKDDKQLWESVKSGYASSLEALFRRHYEALYDYGTKLSRQEELVKDAIQEVFAYIWEKRSSVANIESPRAYLLVSLRRQLFSALKKQDRRQSLDTEFGVEHLDRAFSIEDLLILQEVETSRHEAVAKAVEQIPTRIREALYLKTYDGLTYKEIASIMNVQQQVARNYVSEAYARLRTLLK